MGATLVCVARKVSVRQLRNHTSEVVAAVRAGERLALTVNREPVADIVPHAPSRSPWIPGHLLRTVVADAGADPGLINDLTAVRGELIEGE